MYKNELNKSLQNSTGTALVLRVHFFNLRRLDWISIASWRFFSNAAHLLIIILIMCWKCWVMISALKTAACLGFLHYRLNSYWGNNRPDVVKENQPSFHPLPNTLPLNALGSDYEFDCTLIVKWLCHIGIFKNGNLIYNFACSVKNNGCIHFGQISSCQAENQSTPLCS